MKGTNTMPNNQTCRAHTLKGSPCVRAGVHHVVVQASTFTMYSADFMPGSHVGGSWHVADAYLCNQHAEMLAENKPVRTLVPFIAPITKENATMPTNLHVVCPKHKVLCTDATDDPRPCPQCEQETIMSITTW